MNEKKMFWEGVNFYHVAGLCLLLWGAYLPNEKIFEGGGFLFVGNLTQLAGAVAFFYELVKSFVKNRHAK